MRTGIAITAISESAESWQTDSRDCIKPEVFTMTIMVVDSNFERLFEFEQCLRSAFPVDIIKLFYDSLQAIKFSLQHDIDVVFTEIEMPRFSGSILAQEILKIHENAKVFFVTDKGTPSGVLDMCGVSGCLVRPVTEESIHEIIETMSKHVERKMDKTPSFRA